MLLIEGQEADSAIHQQLLKEYKKLLVRILAYGHFILTDNF